MPLHHRKTLLLFIFVFLAALTVLAVPRAAFAGETVADTIDPATVDARDWMSNLPDDVLITDLNIPGAHDAAASRLDLSDQDDLPWAKTQIYHIGDQKWLNKRWFKPDEWKVDTGLLQRGVRYLDLRFDNLRESEDSELVLTHGGYNAWYVVFNDYFGTNRCEDLVFDKCMEYLHDFLRDHPRETVILEISQDGNRGSQNRVQRKLYEFFKSQAETPTWTSTLPSGWETGCPRSARRVARWSC